MPKITQPVITLIVITLVNCLGSLSPASALDFVNDVYVVLQRSCFECHGAERQEAGFRLDIESEFEQSGVVESGDPTASELVRRISLPRNHDEVMPVVGDPLSPAEVQSIRKWVAEGAQWPADFTPPRHWAYVAPERTSLPNVSNQDWGNGPLDQFVLAKLNSLEMQPSPKANRSVLLRRVFLDLIGLPPTLDEVLAFDADSSEDALDKVVDDLLSRPQFGERWARPWLDLARYADSHGFQRDDLRDLWAYRDWVIQALNDDMPFDQFTIEQLAGDLLPDATDSQRIATGFHRCAPTNVEAGSLPEETRSEQIIDRVNTTASVWLGSTLECAQCHDHKFDPFTIKEYYEFFAIFNNTKIEAVLSSPKKASSIGFVGAPMALSDAAKQAKRSGLQKQKRQWTQKQSERRKVLVDEVEDSVVGLRELIADTPKFHSMSVTSFESKGNTDSYEIRDDGAVLLVGSDPPDKDTYVVNATIDGAALKGSPIRGIRLDVLTDPTLPGTGPGRGDPARTNFVLNEFEVEILGEADQSTRLAFTSAEADFSQGKYDAGSAIDGDAKTGWAIAPQFKRPHHATFMLEEPHVAGGKMNFRLTLRQNFGKARSIGCFRVSVVTGDTRSRSVPANIVKIAKRPVGKWTEPQRKAVIDYKASIDESSKQFQAKIDELNEAIKDVAAETTEVMVELETPRESYIFERGDYRSQGEPVQPGVPDWLHSLSENDSHNSPPNRLDLARWLVDPANPLVARVTVNRWWMEFFGEGLVRTPEDFGIKGDRPTHSKLLDWLAVEFVDSGWSMKHILKTIVLSATYQQSSQLTDELIETDDRNLTLARGPRVRMDAEMVRDNALAVSGLISLKQAGPPIKPFQPANLWTKVGGQNYPYVVSPGDEKFRRGVYVVIKRGSPYPSFMNFDGSPRFACTVQRSRSNTPLQALTLLNDPVYVEAAKAMAVRAASKATQQSVDSTLVDEFRSVVARLPDANETAALRELLDEQSRVLDRDPSGAERLATGVTLPAGVSQRQFATWYAVSTVLLNLHETITKE